MPFNRLQVLQVLHGGEGGAGGEGEGGEGGDQQLRGHGGRAPGLWQKPLHGIPQQGQLSFDCLPKDSLV